MLIELMVTSWSVMWYRLVDNYGKPDSTQVCRFTLPGSDVFRAKFCQIISTAGT